MTDFKSTRFEMRAPNAWLAKVDNWRRRNAELPPRAEAIRRLVELGLHVTDVGIGDLVTHRDGRHGTVVGLDEANPLMANVEFYDEHGLDTEESVPFQILTISHRNGESR